MFKLDSDEMGKVLDVVELLLQAMEQNETVKKNAEEYVTFGELVEFKAALKAKGPSA